MLCGTQTVTEPVHLTQQRPQDGDRQPLQSLTAGTGREGHADQAADAGHGGGVQNPGPQGLDGAVRAED